MTNKNSCFLISIRGLIWVLEATVITFLASIVKEIVLHIYCSDGGSRWLGEVEDLKFVLSIAILETCPHPYCMPG